MNGSGEHDQIPGLNALNQMTSSSQNPFNLLEHLQSSSSRPPNSQNEQQRVHWNGLGGQTVPQFPPQQPNPFMPQLSAQLLNRLPLGLDSQWQNQSHPQVPQFPNGLGMQNPAGFNFQLPPEFILEALRNTGDIQSQDEPLIIQALVEANRAGHSYKVALNGLHCRNGHTASLWKDYYLDNKQRFDDAVSKQLKAPSSSRPTPLPKGVQHAPSVSAPVRAIRKPSPSMFKVESSSSTPASPVQTAIKRKKSVPSRSKSKTKSRSPAVPPTLPTAPSKRGTINSMTAPAVFGRDLPPPNKEVKIPDPPSRSPTPPTNVVQVKRGHKFTDEDREFFHNFISWRLKSNPNLNRTELCEMLAEKVPHHSAQSWGSYWSNNHDIPDKIFAHYKAGGWQSEPESSDESTMVRKRPKYKDLSTSDEEESGDDSDSDSDLPSFDERKMGMKGELFTRADMAILARHISKVPDFEKLGWKTKFGKFGQKYPERSPASWKEYYRKHAKDINRLARKIARHRRSS